MDQTFLELVATARCIDIPPSRTNAGMIRNPPPTPTKPVSTPTPNPSPTTFHTDLAGFPAAAVMSIGRNIMTDASSITIAIAPGQASIDVAISRVVRRPEGGFCFLFALKHCFATQMFPGRTLYSGGA
jgi:hypothetical protein